MSQGQSYGVDFFRGTTGEIGDRVVFDLSVFPVGVPQEMAEVFALGKAGVDEHSDYNIIGYCQINQEINRF